MSEQALDDARTAAGEIANGNYRDPLHGVPVAVKDLCQTKGVRTIAGSKILSDWLPEEDATVVRRLRQAGAGVTVTLDAGTYSVAESGGLSTASLKSRAVPLKVNSSDGLMCGFLLESIAVVTIIVVMLGYAFLYTRRRSRIHE